MKKTTLKTRLYHKILTQKKRIKQTRKARITKHRKKNAIHKKGYKKTIKYISAPEHFGVFDSDKRKIFLAFLAKLRIRAKEGGTCIISFQKTKSIDADGGILLKAEIFRLKKIFSLQVTFRCTPSKSDKINQVLKQIRIFEDLKYSSNISLTRGDVVHWCCAHGNLVDGEKYEPVLGGYDGRITAEISTGLYSAITEAMANSVDHAYKYKARKDGLRHYDTSNDWWMFTQSYDNKLHVAFCDLGAGIPETISESLPTLHSLIKRIGIKKDCDIIKFATGTGKSRTEKSYRGKGLPQMVRTIKNIPDAKLAIFSNKGILRAIEGKINTHEYKNSSILGTLVLWELPLSKVEINQ